MTRLVDLDAMPDPTDFTAAAEFYLATADLRSWTVRASKALSTETKERGEIETLNGTLTQIFHGFEYPAQIADEIPELGFNQFSFALPMHVDHSRVLDILLEAMPELGTEIRSQWKVGTKVNGKAASELAKDIGSKAGERVRQLRVRDTQLGLKE